RTDRPGRVEGHVSRHRRFPAKSERLPIRQLPDRQLDDSRRAAGDPHRGGTANEDRSVMGDQNGNFACGFEDNLRQYPRAASAARFASPLSTMRFWVAQTFLSVSAQTRMSVPPEIPRLTMH